MIDNKLHDCIQKELDLYFSFPSDQKFGMVNVGLPGHDINNSANVALDTMMSGDLANETFKKWISLKVNWSTWLLNEEKLDKIKNSKVRSSNYIYVSEVINVSQWWHKNRVHHHLAVRHLGALDSNGDETNEGMEIVAMLKSATRDTQQQHNVNGCAIIRKRECNE
ncbi:unnamed protein product [Sphagnum tenellum]